MAKTTRKKANNTVGSSIQLPPRAARQQRWWSNIHELYLHRHTDNCSKKWQKAKVEEAPLLLVVHKAMFLKTPKLCGDHKLRDCTTKGIKIPPAALTTAS